MFREPSGNQPRLRNRKGAMLVFVALSTVALLGMLSLVIDVGAGSRQRRIAQTAADAGATAGGTQILRFGNDADAAISAAVYYATQMNGFANAEVLVNHPPAAGTLHGGDKAFVEVIINRNIPTIFGSIFNKSSLDIRARAVAGLGSVSHYCMVGLGPGVAIDMGGEIHADTCSIVSNSSIDAKKIYVIEAAAVGSIDRMFSGTDITGIPPVPDPYASLQVPANNTCDYFNTLVTSTTTLPPGVYCGDATHSAITVAGHNVTLSPGVFFLRGGLNGIANNSDVRGDNVTIINSNTPDNLPSSFHPIEFGNTCGLRLTAPSAGPYAGIAVFQDPAAPASATKTDYVNRFCGKGGNPDIVGVLYFPTQSFSLDNANGKLTISGAIVARFITTGSNGAKFFPSINGSSSSPRTRTSLVE